jgi:hypothetical protein
MIFAESTKHWKGTVMNKVSMMKSLVVAVALAAGVSGVAHADGGMGRFGDSYAYFNSQPIDKSHSAWRASHPNGLSDRQLQALSSEALASDFTKPTFDKAPSTFRPAYPNGLSERQLQALSSEASAWHSSPQAATGAAASTNGAVIASMAAK